MTRAVSEYSEYETHTRSPQRDLNNISNMNHINILIPAMRKDQVTWRIHTTIVTRVFVCLSCHAFWNVSDNSYSFVAGEWNELHYAIKYWRIVIRLDQPFIKWMAWHFERFRFLFLTNCPNKTKRSSICLCLSTFRTHYKHAPIHSHPIS